MVTEKEFEEYLVSIGGLVNGYFIDREPITTNICECGEGWLGLIKDLIQELIELGWNKQIRQIKEKFGGLRFYTDSMTDEMYEVVRRYEILASQTCEVCGTTEGVEQRGGGWIRTLCDKHIKKD